MISNLCSAVVLSLALLWTRISIIAVSLDAYLFCLHHTLQYSIDYHSRLPLISTDIQGMIVMCPFFDNIEQLTNFKYTLPCVTRIGEKSIIVKCE